MSGSNDIASEPVCLAIVIIILTGILKIKIGKFKQPIIDFW